WVAALTQVSSIRPRLVNPWLTNKTALLKKPSPCTVRVESAVVVKLPLIVSPARMTMAPWLTKAALTVLLVKVRVRPAALVSVPGRLTVELFTVRVVVALLKSGVNVAVVLDKASVPVPVTLPASKLNEPPLIVSVRAPRSMAPVVWKLGLLLIDRSPP